MPEIISRSTWDTTGDRRRFARPLAPSRVKGVVLHYPGDGNHTRAGLSVARVSTLLRAYQRYHRIFRKWPDIGYCLAVDQAGRLYEAAGPKVAAHSATTQYRDANHERVGVLLVIGDNEAPSPAMRATVGWLREALPAGRVPGWPALPGCHDLHGHRQMRGASTQCPGTFVLGMIARGEFTASRTDVRPPIIQPTGKLRLDGKFGPFTVATLQRALAAVGEDPGPPDGDFGPRSKRALQRWLARCGFNPGPFDGDFGPYSTRALQRWLASHRLYNEPVHGRWDHLTTYALQNALNSRRIR